ncbi:Nodulation protein N [Thiomonas sp. X19]|nr:Nodulation protein N [Thiomonas sp. X19]
MEQAAAKPLGIDALRARAGEVIGTSPWLLIEQSRINAFAEATLDHQFIHVDPARAQATPLGSTIAHGFLTLSLLSHFAEAVLPDISSLAMSMNYGFDRVRFVAPVRTGSRIRGVFSLVALEQQAANRFQMRLAVTVEIEGEVKPALVADWQTVLFMVQD